MGIKIKKKVGINTDSVILVENDNLSIKSTAALKILRQLPGLWKLAYGLILVPESWRNWVYDFIAKKRYKWFGKTTCDIKSVDYSRNKF